MSVCFPPVVEELSPDKFSSFIVEVLIFYPQLFFLLDIFEQGKE